MDNILKPFPSTTAFFHNHHCLNFMLGLRKAQQHPESKPGLRLSRAFADKHEPRQGKNPAEEAANFWVQACFSSGMLLKYSGKFYLATGSTPAVLTASGIDCELYTCITLLRNHVRCSPVRGCLLERDCLSLQGTPPDGDDRRDASAVPSGRRGGSAEPGFEYTCSGAGRWKAGFGQKCGRSERISITNCCRDMIQQLRFDYEEASGVVGTTL